MRPRLALTMGDPAGIGPEIAVRACAETAVSQAAEVQVIGARVLLERCAAQLSLPPLRPEQVVEPPLPPGAADEIRPGTCSAAGGAISAACIEAAIAGCLAGRWHGMVTGPISKRAVQWAGVPFPGHTEWLAARCGVREETMLLYAPTIAVALVTCHAALTQAIAQLRPERIVATGLALDQALRRLRGRAPRLAVLGLNPHAGEDGLFGSEDAAVVAPAVAQLRAQGLDVHGPLPPDTAFTPHARERYDGWVCLYHDQGLIPFKALAFDQGVNITLGLPLVRTSVDHGTAFDIAGTGTADHRSLVQALLLAARLSDPAASGTPIASAS